MSRLPFIFCVAAVVSLTGLMMSGAVAEPGQSTSHVAYVYPAGAQQGSSIEVTAGGQGLRNVQEIYISGEGVKARVVRRIPGFKKLYGDYLKHLQKEARTKQQLLERKKKRRKTKRNPQGKKGKRSEAEKKKKDKEEMEPPPDHPIFRDLRKRSLPELEILLKRYYRGNLQKNREMDELLLIKLTVNSDAEPGMREMRIRTAGGLSNPMRFYIGTHSEFNELEPNEKEPRNAVMIPPFVINGQILPGDIDRFQLKAKAGQQLLIQGHARSILPFLADAVPGWFQATLTLYDAQGQELSYADDYRFSPDPVLIYKIPEDGLYTIQICDSIYRGREDFVYRISVGEDPFISHIFPLGGRKNTAAKVELSGWNLPSDRVNLNTSLALGTRPKLQLGNSNHIPYAVDDLAECQEKPENDTLKHSQFLKLPMIVNGRIERPGDVDVFRFNARAGERFVVEVNARRLHSPVDSKLKWMDASGKVLAWNDDYEQLNLGMQTHHADSRITMRAPKKGTYYVSMADTQGKGGPEYGYRLRLSRPLPGFQLNATPSSITVRQGCSVPLTIYSAREDGFEGEIDIILKGAPKGFRLSGATIPPGADKVTMTLTAPTDAKNKLFEIRLQGRAKVDRGIVRRDVQPGYGMTQAFITEHVVPSQKMMVYVAGWGEVIELELPRNEHVIIPKNGEATFRVKKTKSESDLVLKLYQAPDGLTLTQKRASKNSMTVSLKASHKVKSGTAGNLLIEVLRTQKQKNGKVKSYSLGVMPAVPYVVE